MSKTASRDTQRTIAFDMEIPAKTKALADAYEQGGLTAMKEAGKFMCNWNPNLCAMMFEEGRRRSDRLLTAECINTKERGATLGDIVAELVRRADDADAFCDYIDEQFLGGAWADVFRALDIGNQAALNSEEIVPRFADARTFARDIRGLCLALARLAARGVGRNSEYR